MKALFDIFSSVIYGTTKLDVYKLPTQGYFYPKDFEIKIKRVSIEDIIEYEYNFNPDNVLEIIEVIKVLVRKNVEFSKNYKFEDLKSIDIVFIFLEIVKFTNKKPIKITYFDNASKQPVEIDFNHKYFNYFDFGRYKKFHIPELGVFQIDDYKFSMPSIGVEHCLTRFLLERIESKSDFYNEQSYDFLFFLGNKNSLTDDDVDNLITIFNQDIDGVEKDKIKSIISKFQSLIGYSLRVGDRIIDLKANLDLANIWKE